MPGSLRTEPLWLPREDFDLYMDMPEMPRPRLPTVVILLARQLFSLMKLIF
jgi:hypothetical protein